VTDRARLTLWSTLVAVMIALAYAGRATSGKPDANVLYEYSTAAATIVQYAIILALVLAIAGFRRDLLALRAPRSLLGSLGLLFAALVIIQILEAAYAAAVHLGNEQGLTPERWEPAHATAYIVNGLLICTLVPFVEELTFRGLGVSVVLPYGRWTAILVTGVAFGLAHGLLLSLPVLAAFGCVLAWLRLRTASVVPGMALHALFNAIALVLAVTT
jgi:membrane protease YdiL (CAAX protease family)